MRLLPHRHNARFGQTSGPCSRTAAQGWNDRGGEKGGVLIWILIAVALFAALSYAMLRDGGSSSAAHTMSDAQARLAAAEIMAYGDAVAQTVQTMRLRGVKESEIDFKNDVWERCSGAKDYYPIGNLNSDSDEKRIFHAAGGALQAKFFSPPTIVKAGDVCSICSLCLKEGHMQVSSISVAGIGTELPELALLISGIPEPVCKQINKMAGVNDGTEIPVDNTDGAWTWKGTFGGTGTLGDDAPELAGRTGFCIKHEAGAPRQQYWRVLIAR
ncbi:MAG: hypothetical protein WC989_07230 [Micavibrio sp.]